MPESSDSTEMRPHFEDIQAHYDLSDEFFALFQDPTRKYSCARRGTTTSGSRTSGRGCVAPTRPPACRTTWRSSKWNLDKRYLRELDAGGVETIPTVWSEPGAEGSAEEELARLGWPMVVIKPVVDLGAMNLVRVPAALAGQMLERFDRPVITQPYLESIETSGELSLVFVEGELMHSLRKVPARGDFRIQPLYGGTHQAPSRPPPRSRRRSSIALPRGPALRARRHRHRGGRAAAGHRARADRALALPRHRARHRRDARRRDARAGVAALARGDRGGAARRAGARRSAGSERRGRSGRARRGASCR